MEPCGVGQPCEDGLNCHTWKAICVVPCSTEAESQELANIEAQADAKRVEIESRRAELEGALSYFAAKFRGAATSSFITADIQAYEQPITYCSDDLDIDTSSAWSEICTNMTDSEDIDNEVCNSPPEPVQGQICNENATTGEVLVHDNIIEIQRLAEEIAALDQEAEDMLLEIETDVQDRMGDFWSEIRMDCLSVYQRHRDTIDWIEGAVAVVMQFIEEYKCVIVALTMKLLAMVIDKIIAAIPVLGESLKAMQAQPQCQTIVSWRTFSLQLPGYSYW